MLKLSVESAAQFSHLRCRQANFGQLFHSEKLRSTAIRSAHSRLPTHIAEKTRHFAFLLQLAEMISASSDSAPTLFLLMAQYGGRAVVPIELVCRDFFAHLTVDKLLRKALRGDITLPIVRIEQSQKAARGVHLVDLAAYLDKRRAAAIRERDLLCGPD